MPLETKILLLISEDGKRWVKVADVVSETEIADAEAAVPEGVHMMRVYSWQSKTKGNDAEENQRG